MKRVGILHLQNLMGVVISSFKLYTLGSSGIKACGENVSLYLEGLDKAVLMKQEESRIIFTRIFS